MTMRTDPDAQAMQADYADLRKKAEAATPGPWYATPLHVRANETEDRLGFDLNIKHANGNRDDWRKLTAYIAAANPSVVLGLLDELATLRSRLAEGGEAQRVAFVTNIGGAKYGQLICDLPIGTDLYRTPPTHTAAVQAERERAARVAEEFSDGLKQEADNWAKLGSKIDAEDSYLLANLAAQIAVHIRTGWTADEINGGKP